YDAEALGSKMAAEVDPARAPAEPEVARGQAAPPAEPAAEVARGQGAPAGELASAGERSLLGVRMGTVESAAAHTAQGAAIGAAAGVAIEAGRELLTG